MGVRRWRSIFSRTLESNGRRLIGLEDVTSVGFSWFGDYYNLSYLPVAGKVSEVKNRVVDLCYCSNAFVREFFEDSARN